MDRVLFRKIALSLGIAAGGWWVLWSQVGGEQRALSGFGSVTFHQQISRVLQDHCQSCHRSGGAAPFPLETYSQVYAQRDQIYRAVESGRMPICGG